MKPTVLVCAILCITATHARDIGNFYYAQLFPGEPHFEKPWLAEGYLRMAASTSDFSFDANGNRRPLFDMYGTHDPTTWARELTDIDPDNTIDQLLLEIQDQTFPPITTSGDMELIQADMQYTQNLSRGCFVAFHMPIRHFDFSHVNIMLSQTESSLEQSFSKQLPDIISRLGFEKSTRNDGQLGDITLLCGYTNNYEETTNIDFIDTTIYTGILTPSSPELDPTIIFDVPSGHNGRTGCVIGYRSAAGLYDWLTFGTFLRAIIFAPHITTTRIHTVRDGRGWIAPRSARVHLSDGHIVNAGMYTKADHVVQGLSFLFGYSYQQKRDTHVTPRDADARQDVNVSKDERFREWNQHTFHWKASYDFAHENHPHAPELTVFCDHIVDGNRVFESTTGGIRLGCNLTFSY